jgi:hypothetical protein
MLALSTKAFTLPEIRISKLTFMDLLILIACWEILLTLP